MFWLWTKSGPYALSLSNYGRIGYLIVFYWGVQSIKERGNVGMVIPDNIVCFMINLLMEFFVFGFKDWRVWMA